MRLPLPRTAWLWLALTAVAIAVLSVVAFLQSNDRALWWIAAGAGVSLATLVASKLTVAAARATDQALQRLLIETSTRMALPLGVLLAVAVTQRDLLTPTFLLYFLPFQFITIVADTLAAVQELEAETDGNSGRDA